MSNKLKIDDFENCSDVIFATKNGKVKMHKIVLLSGLTSIKDMLCDICVQGHESLVIICPDYDRRQVKEAKDMFYNFGVGDLLAKLFSKQEEADGEEVDYDIIKEEIDSESENLIDETLSFMMKSRDDLLSDDNQGVPIGYYAHPKTVEKKSREGRGNFMGAQSWLKLEHPDLYEFWRNASAVATAFGYDGNSFLCTVCNELPAATHYGVRICEGEKQFIKRTFHKMLSYSPCMEGSCPPRKRGWCQACRLKACLTVPIKLNLVRCGPNFK